MRLVPPALARHLLLPCVFAVFGGALSGQKIHTAAQLGELGKVRALLEGDAKLVHQLDSSQRTPLHLAARYGQLEVAKLLVGNGADVNRAAYNKFTPLMLAAHFGRLEVVQYLVDQGATLELKASTGNTALVKAAANGHTAVVEFLRKKGARYDLEAAIRLGDLEASKSALEAQPGLAKRWRTIWEAARRGEAAITRLLLENGAPTVARNPMMGPVPILIPGIQHPKVVEALLAGGAEVDPILRNYKGVAPGTTPLLLAAIKGYAESVEALLRHRANAKAIDDRGWSTVHGAAAFGDAKLVRRFLDLGVDGKTPGRGGFTPMMAAARQIRPPRNPIRTKSNAGRNQRFLVVIAELRKTHPMDLYTAVSVGKVARVRELLAKDRAVSVDGSRGLNALMIRAVKLGHPVIVDLLCSKGAEVDGVDGSGYRALHWASFWSQFESAKVLVDRGADLDARTKNGFTPLHECARLGSSKVAELLLRAGADKTVRDRRGQLPFDLIGNYGDPAAMRRLLKN